MSSIYFFYNRYIYLFIFFIILPSFLFLSCWITSYIYILCGISLYLLIQKIKYIKSRISSVIILTITLFFISILFYQELKGNNIYPIYHLIKSITEISNSSILILSLVISNLIGFLLGLLFLRNFNSLFKIDKFFIKSFLPPFISSFCIAIFIFLMQFLWKWVDELIGKGLEIDVIFHLIYYAAARFVPLSIPIAILIASIMTFGNLGEKYELSAIKSSGISIQKSMSALVFFAILISYSSFLYSNHVLPIATLKNGLLLHDIQRKKPSINIKEKEFFTDIDKYSILVNTKQKKTNTLNGIYIKDQTSNKKNNKTILASSGNMKISSNKKYLEIELDSANFYNEINNNKHIDHEKINAVKGISRFDITKFGLIRSKESIYKNHYMMMSVRQLTRSIDSLKIELSKKKQNIKNNYINNFTLQGKNISKDLNKLRPRSIKSTSKVIEIKKENSMLFDYAINKINANKSISQSNKDNILHRESIIAHHKVEWHRKFTVSFACIILFFVGSSLGSIIRKGGFSIPLLVSIILYVIYHVLTMIGEKQVKEMLIDPWIGMWITNFIFFLLSIFLLYQSKRESYLMRISFYKQLINNFTNREKSNKS